MKRIRRGKGSKRMMGFVKRKSTEKIVIVSFAIYYRLCGKLQMKNEQV
jgi:hypothetical protein